MIDWNNLCRLCETNKGAEEASKIICEKCNDMEASFLKELTEDQVKTYYKVVLLNNTYGVIHDTLGRFGHAKYHVAGQIKQTKEIWEDIEKGTNNDNP